jgi:hypothetical protein
MATFDDAICARCGEPMPNGEVTHFELQCKFIPCAEGNCRALRDPVYGRDMEDAYRHWRYHVLHATLQDTIASGRGTVSDPDRSRPIGVHRRPRPDAGDV